MITVLHHHVSDPVSDQPDQEQLENPENDENAPTLGRKSHSWHKPTTLLDFFSKVISSNCFGHFHCFSITHNYFLQIFEKNAVLFSLFYLTFHLSFLGFHSQKVKDRSTYIKAISVLNSHIIFVAIHEL